MKKIVVFILMMVCMIGIIGYGVNVTYEISIIIPTTKFYVYSDEELFPIGHQITISTGKGLRDNEVFLKVIESSDAVNYEPMYLTPGMPIKMNVEKDRWFKIGLLMQNETDTNRTVYVKVKGVKVRIE